MKVLVLALEAVPAAALLSENMHKASRSNMGHEVTTCASTPVQALAVLDAEVWTAIAQALVGSHTGQPGAHVTHRSMSSCLWQA